MARPTTVHTCRDCGVKVITGLDADVAGIPTTVDQTPVDELGEFLAVATGRLTFDLRPIRTGRGHNRQLTERGPHAIAQPRRHPVHALHRCGQPLPQPAAEAPATRTAANTVIIEGAPF